MPSVALLLRLSTFLLVPLLVLTGLGSLDQGRAEDSDARTVTRARALMAAASTDAPPAGPDTPSPEAAAAAASTPQPDDEPAEKATAQATKAAEAEEAASTAEKPAEATTAETAADATKAEAEAATAAEAEKAAEAKDEKAADADRAVAAAPADVRPRSLYLAVGHGRAPNGRWQPGAEHPGTGAVEVDAAQIMVDAMVEVLQDAPGVQLTSESGDHPNVIGSVAAANAAGVDDCVEIHQDTVVAPPGAFAHWYTGSKAAQRLADGIVGSIQERGVAIRTDWHRERPGLYFLRKSLCRAVLVEVGRVDDFGPEKLRELGRGMAQAYLADTAAARGVEVS